MLHPPLKNLNVFYYSNSSLVFYQYQPIGKDHDLAIKTLHPHKTTALKTARQPNFLQEVDNPAAWCETEQAVKSSE